jgi:hypothetical protein
MALDKMMWDELKKTGSEHYRNGEIQPFDLYRSMAPDAFRHWVTLEAVQHLLRNLIVPRSEYIRDLEKAEHYIKTLKVLWLERDEELKKVPIPNHSPTTKVSS